MKKDTVVSIDEPTTTKDALTEMLRAGAQKLLAEAVQAELEELLEEYEGQRDGQGRKRLVRNGYLPKREIQTGIGGIPGAVASLLAEGSGGDYGVHSEMFTTGLMRLHKAGKTTAAQQGDGQDRRGCVGVGGHR